MDELALSVVSLLENHPRISSVDFTERRGVTDQELQAWESANFPYLLPADLKSFLLISDGLVLRWKIRHQGREHPLGSLHLNRLKDMAPCQFGSDDDSDDSEDDVVGKSAGRSASGSPSHGPRTMSMRAAQKRAAFDLDTGCHGGRVVLLYTTGPAAPEVWFQDMSCNLCYVAKTFTDYFRLLVMHLGIPSWQYAFAEAGLDPVCEQWFRLLSPERLAINRQAVGRGGRGGAASRADRPAGKRGLVVGMSQRGSTSSSASTGWRGARDGGGTLSASGAAATSSAAALRSSRPLSAPPRRSGDYHPPRSSRGTAFSRASRNYRS